MKRHQTKSIPLKINLSSTLGREKGKVLNSTKFKSNLVSLNKSLVNLALKDKEADLLLGKRGVRSIEMSVTLCGEKKIRSLNKDFRGKNKSTDVLSFQIHDALRGGDSYSLPNPLELGDIYICYEIALKQSREFGISLREEILHLIVHGYLHLLGFDHEISPEEEKIMNKLESKILNQIAKAN